MASQADVQTILKEYIHPNLTKIQESDRTLFNWFKKTKAVPASTRASRIEMKVASGGRTKRIDFDAGQYPAGTNQKIMESTVSTVGLTHGRQLSELSKWASDSDRKAIINAMTDLVTDALQEFHLYFDMFLNAPNTGVLGIILDTTTFTAPKYSVNAAGNPWGTALLREGNEYDIYDSTLATLRAGGPYVIDADSGLDYEGQGVTFGASITGAAALDRIVLSGGVNNAITGLPDLVSDASSGTIQGVSRAKEWVRARRVDANSTALEWAYLRLALNKVRQRKGADRTKTLTPYMGFAQHHAYESMAQSITELTKGRGNEDFDLMYGEGKIAGRDVLLGTHADPTKVMWLDQEAFIRPEVKSIDFKTDRGGNYIFPLYGAPAGGITAPIAAEAFWLCWQGNIACVDFTNLSYVDELLVPSGYIS